MAPLAQTLTQMAVVGLTMFSQVQAIPSPAANDASKPALRLMPLGASITYGYLSTDGNGYRADLRDLLTGDGYSVDMVGSRKAGKMQDNDNEGWPGYRVGQVLGKASKSVPGLQPNLFTVNAGTNDCAQNYELSTVGDRMGDMLEYLWNTSAGSTIILSTLIINLNKTIEARVEDVNNQYRALAKKKAAEGKKIVLAEMHADDGPQPNEMADGTHPNDEGYDKMAKIWFRTIKEAQSKGFLTAPNPTNN